MIPLAEVVGGWSAFCWFMMLVGWLVERWERAHPHLPACDLLLTPAERRAEARLIPADAATQVIREAERMCREVDLEAAWCGPCASNPRLRYVNGDLERRLAEQRRREAKR